MPRIEGVRPEAAAPFTRKIMDENRERFGEVLPGTAIQGLTPTIQEGTQALNRGIGAAGGISQQLRGLMNVRVAQIVGCPF